MGGKLVNMGIGLVTALFTFWFITDRSLSGLNIVIFVLVFGGVWGALSLESGESERRR